MISNKEIVNYLSNKTTKAGLIDKLKIKYRPIICPFNILLSYARDKKSVADIGCGSGQFCALLAEFSNVKEIYGIEVNKNLIQNANEVNKEYKNHKQISFEAFDGKIIPEHLNKYDLVYLIDVFHHIPYYQQEKFIKEVYSKMKKGATLVFKDIDAAHLFVYFNKIHDLIFSKEIGKEKDVDSMKELLINVGFEIKSAFKKRVFVYPHYFLIAEK